MTNEWMDEMDGYSNQNWILPSSTTLMPVADVEQRIDSWPISQQQQQPYEMFDSITNTASSSDDSWSKYSSSINYYPTTAMTMMKDNVDRLNNPSQRQLTINQSVRNRHLANDQERKRMHRLNEALFRLKEV